MQAGEITIQLRRWRNGDPEALCELTPLVYEHLRMLAGTSLSRERSAHALQPTELVGELFVELLKLEKVRIEDRNHFFAFAARVMRQILIQHARSLNSEKRGARRLHIPLNAELAWTGNGNGSGAATIDLNAVMDELEALDATCVRAVELRYFFGFTADETAEMLSVSRSTIDRHIRFALTWLHSRLHREL